MWSLIFDRCLSFIIKLILILSCTILHFILYDSIDVFVLLAYNRFNPAELKGFSSVQCMDASRPTFYGDLKERVKIQEKRPIVLVCKTNPYEGFSADNYENLKEKEEMNNSGGKKDLVFEFMNYYEYFKLYENDYFILYEPNSEREMEKWELWSK